MNDQAAFAIAVEEAKKSFDEGGVPIGAALVSRDGKLLGRGHNMRVQLGSPIHHGEISALMNSGRLPAAAYRGATMYTTLSPCDMCTGASILYGISRVVIGENETFLGGEAYLKQRGIEVVNLQSTECKELMEKFIKEKPEIWYVENPGHAKMVRELKGAFNDRNEDIGEEERVHSKESK